MTLDNQKIYYNEIIMTKYGKFSIITSGEEEYYFLSKMFNDDGPYCLAKERDDLGFPIPEIRLDKIESLEILTNNFISHAESIERPYLSSSLRLTLKDGLTKTLNINKPEAITFLSSFVGQKTTSDDEISAIRRSALQSIKEDKEAEEHRRVVLIELQKKSKEKAKKLNIIAAVVFFIIIILIASKEEAAKTTLIVSSEKANEAPTESNADEPTESNDSFSQAENYAILNHEIKIREKLKDPDSAIFSDIKISKSGGIPVACGKVNSKNSFGGYIGAQRFISNGLQVNVLEEEMQDMNELWNKFCL